MKRFSPHLLTAPFPVAQRLDLARADAAAGLMTAEDAVELAAELVATVREKQSGKGRAEKRHRRKKAEAEAHRLGQNLAHQKWAVGIILGKIEAALPALRFAGDHARELVEQIEEWAADLRAAHGIPTPERVVS